MSSKVLVVEDEIFVAIELESLLHDLGHQPVGIAADSRQALALAEQAELAFVDVNLLDGPTGVEVGKALAAAATPRPAPRSSGATAANEAKR
jgi:CheY-like chemotaxis protein